MDDEGDADEEDDWWLLDSRLSDECLKVGVPVEDPPVETEPARVLDTSPEDTDVENERE